MLLIVKATREIAATTQLRKPFCFYLVPLRAGDVHTHGSISAFFDEEESREILQVLSSDSFEMSLFDEHDRELIGFSAENPNATRFRSFTNTIQLVPFSLEKARQFHDDMMFWFGTRSTADDNAALKIDLLETQLADNSYPQSQTPGEFNERDI